MSLRILSAGVLAPPVLLAIYAGSPFTDLLVLIAGVAMTWEAGNVVFGASKPWQAVVAMAGTGAAVICAGFYSYGLALAVLAVTAAGVPAAIRTRSGLILAGAAFYLGTGCLAFLWLRQLGEGGLLMVAWLIASVWATDIAAYFAGRAIGGPRLAPRISPKKTWAGLLGGAAGAAAVGVGFALGAPEVRMLMSLPGPLTMAAVGVALAVVAQLGDLLASAFKRYFDVKDASHLIPGHGGVIDRADGLLAASLAVAFATMLTKGA
ncbi:phosphatidate cytidylyltransferase [Ferruginivarius sediminum]|uniref:Phosphatidate cytidylyltransferase n=1 Tax=Ferruginivarius sediminum TaxID=2661937 RepID=A0A369TCD4_9PROT|nr:phosphatidate cytidylyltransferase [Ferruginivarius sediminum]